MNRWMTSQVQYGGILIVGDLPASLFMWETPKVINFTTQKSNNKHILHSYYCYFLGNCCWCLQLIYYTRCEEFVNWSMHYWAEWERRGRARGGGRCFSSTYYLPKPLLERSKRTLGVFVCLSVCLTCEPGTQRVGWCLKNQERGLVRRWGWGRVGCICSSVVCGWLGRSEWGSWVAVA